jgi:autotransporter-associated beta strand protein
MILDDDVTTQAHANTARIGSSYVDVVNDATAGTMDLGDATRTFTVADGAAAVDLDVRGVVTSNAGAFGIVKQGDGAMRLSWYGSRYSGPTTVQDGTLLVGGTSVPDADPGLRKGPIGVGTLALEGGTVMVDGDSQTLHNAVTLDNTVTLAAKDNSDLIFSDIGLDGSSPNPFPDVTSGTTLLIERSGIGTGAVQINDPTLIVESGGSLGGSGLLRVGSDGSGEVMVLGSVAPGSSPGNLTIEGALSLPGTYAWELETLTDNDTGVAGADWDTLTVLGPADVTGGTLALSFGTGLDPASGDTFWNEDHTWAILTSDSLTGLLSAPAGYSNGSFSTQAAGNNLQLVWSPAPIPEPVSGAVLALGGLTLLRRRHS